MFGSTRKITTTNMRGYASSIAAYESWERQGCIYEEMTGVQLIECKALTEIFKPYTFKL